ncbi:MAG: RidA family protein [Lysobacterales bacterium]|jgi:reactive intermediate/imine deaminase
MRKEVIHTDQAPSAIGTYSQAIRQGGLVFISGQVPLVPETMEVADGGIPEHIHQVFKNLSAICREAGATLDDIVKLTVYLVDMADFPQVNEVMGEYFSTPYPARAAVGVASLPKGVKVEIDAIVAT